MIKEKYLTDSVIYKKYLGDVEGYEAEYADYTLDGMLVREKYSFDENEVEGSETIAYYFPEITVCKNKKGVECAMPKPEKKDLCVIGGRELRVARVGYFTGYGELSHIRLTLG